MIGLLFMVYESFYSVKKLLKYEWLAYNISIIISCLVVDFFNRINLIYGTISEYCDSASCPTMSGGARFEYLWADGEKYKKPTVLPAPQYVTLLMDWIEVQINNETIFPVSTGISLIYFCHVNI